MSWRGVIRHPVFTRHRFTRTPRFPPSCFHVLSSSWISQTLPCSLAMGSPHGARLPAVCCGFAASVPQASPRSAGQVGQLAQHRPPLRLRHPPPVDEVLIGVAPAPLRLCVDHRLRIRGSLGEVRPSLWTAYLGPCSRSSSRMRAYASTARLPAHPIATMTPSLGPHVRSPSRIGRRCP